jgi:hypothetical protein
MRGHDLISQCSSASAVLFSRNDGFMTGITLLIDGEDTLV